MVRFIITLQNSLQKQFHTISNRYKLQQLEFNSKYVANQQNGAESLMRGQ
jgi:hypothetical protein